MICALYTQSLFYLGKRFNSSVIMIDNKHSINTVEEKADTDNPSILVSVRQLKKLNNLTKELNYETTCTK